jgi:uncharacterized protein YjbI with pentapeptide repeats
MKKNIFSLQTFIAIAFFTLLFVLAYGILNENVPDWWGTNEIVHTTADKENEDFIAPGKTLWDLVDLLLVPFVIALGGYLFNQAQQARNLEFTETQNENQRKISLDQNQEQILQKYLDEMKYLLLEKKLATTKDKTVRKLARSYTLTALRSLNNPYLDVAGRGRNRRKGSLVRFLYEMDLISGVNPVLSLNKANLEFAYMRKGDLSQANFNGAYLKGADLRKAILQEATLIDAYLPEARLNEANLSKADFQKANFLGANLDDAILDGANFEGAIMPDGK